MKLVIFGQPQAGKTTLFEILTGLGGKEKHLAVVKAKDPRLEEVARVEGSGKITHIHISFVDPSTKETLNEMRTGDGLLHVVREDDPLSRIARVEKELLERDRETLEGTLQRSKKEFSKRKTRKLERKIKAIEKALEVLSEGRPLREVFSREEEEFSGLGLLSLKPIIHVINTKFEETSSLKNLEVTSKGRAVVVMDLLTEKELLQSDEEERNLLMEEFGIEELRAEKFVNIIYNTLDLLVFFTVGKKEARAWTLKKGGTALDAAGKIHTDIARGFIRAEVVSWEEFVQAGGWSGLHRAGKIRMEGKEYKVKDGDVLNIRFNK